MIRMLVVGCIIGLRAELRLCQEMHLNLAYRCLCRLGPEDKVSDPSSFAKLRHGKFGDIGIFEPATAQCTCRGLSCGTRFFVDASLINADDQKRQILPLIAVIDKGECAVSHFDFIWDDDKGRYIRPDGKDLRHSRRNYSIRGVFRPG